ncbi:MAG: Phosphate metabolism transcription protein [Vezdaea aestivalis]|nr:MAG: Phosphate metabolism transcription protein [Vezdaea aestivalis]
MAPIIAPAGASAKGIKKESGTARVLGSGSAGILELAVFHPVDTIAKRLMSNYGKIESIAMLNTVIFKDKATAPVTSKFFSLFPGLGYAAGYKVSQRIYKYGGQPFVRDWLAEHYGDNFDRTFGKGTGKAVMYATAGSLIGIGEIFLLPLDVLKIKRQTNPEAFRGRGVGRIIRDEGFGLYRGWGWTAARNAPGSFALFGGSSFTKEYLYQLEDYNQATWGQNFVASIAGASASLIVSAPLDVIKTRIQNRNFENPESGVRIIRSMAKNEGFSSFFKGLTPKLLMTGPKLVFSFWLAQTLIPAFGTVTIQEIPGKIFVQICKARWKIGSVQPLIGRTVSELHPATPNCQALQSFTDVNLLFNRELKMRFGQTLKSSTYAPWEKYYIDYAKLKKLLKEDQQPAAGSKSSTWTEDDEAAFVEELVNSQLEKVNGFQNETFKALEQRTEACEGKLEKLLADPTDDKQAEQSNEVARDKRRKGLKDISKELDGITKETNELEKFSRINFTGFLKAAKKHDRLRGQNYRVKPLLQVRLSALPFNSEDYSPLLYKLSAMYSFVRQNLEEGTEAPANSSTGSQFGRDKYTFHKFWVHPDNILEVKTSILRRLPVLVYNPQSSKVAGGQKDLKLTSLYFDSPQFSLYRQKVEKDAEASSLRLRWYGQLKERPEILFEKKTIKDGNRTEETKFPLKDKYVQRVIDGSYKMEKSITKLKDREGAESERATQLQSSVDQIQSLIKEKELQPVLRANYTRTAFQIPGDDRVRVSLDTELALIREDTLDEDRPCRDPEDWHRVDIDDNELEFPFNGFRKGEISKFPFALLEIKIKDGQRKKRTEWIEDLMSSHLVKQAPRFSKFVHGVAVLFEDYVNSFPFWLPELEKDIRRDPETAFEEEQEKKAKKAEDETALESLLGKSPLGKSPLGRSPLGRSPLPRSSIGSPAGKSAAATRKASTAFLAPPTEAEVEPRTSPTSKPGLSALFPSFSTSRYARAKRRGSVQLPSGVVEPQEWIKDQGPVRVEAKVWLANQRTFVKWQHVSVLLAGLSLGLYNAAGKHNTAARALAIIYTVIAIFAGLWGWGMYIYRSRLIRARSGKDFDNPVGPVLVCVGLFAALCINFGYKYSAALAHSEEENIGLHIAGLVNATV